MIDNNLLLKGILKSKAQQNKSLDEIIDEFINENSKLVKNDLEKAIVNLIVFVNENHDIPLDTLKDMISSKISAMGLSINPLNLEEIYKKLATSVKDPLGFSFDRVDIKAIEGMRNSFVWAKDKFNADFQNKLKDVTQRVFDGKIPKSELAGALKEELKDSIDGSVNYFKGVGDHIISQTNNIARVNQARKRDVQYYEVLAIIDAKTSAICRSMNGRIIPANHINAQADKIMNAKSIKDKKAAAAWASKPFLGKKLPSNFGLPPYHMHCRTELIPVYIEEEEIDGVKMKHTGRKDDELIRHIDKTGVLRSLRKGNYYDGKHSELLYTRAKISDVVKALNSINVMAPNNKRPQRFNAYSDNGFFMVFDGNDIVTFFKPKDGKKHFNKHSTTLDQEIIKRWFI
ncbi:hypothetical protein [Campylobacter pinnipediorum]|uniref:hypothetical protein n=1 Tax=Campylobacter pinnipediorum TaxID=1965231 RepID=UPI00084D306F|nr:hypothetical protein [Campylobacter pinnipediorum]OPA75421.1 hypothetical protein BFG05_05985 [Campylobacter pinnipediorum subsp. pinnipediorum]